MREIRWGRYFLSVAEKEKVARLVLLIVALLADKREILMISDFLRIPQANSPPKTLETPKQTLFDQCTPDDFASLRRQSTVRWTRPNGRPKQGATFRALSRLLADCSRE